MTASGVVVVTGGAGGIGLAVADLLLERTTHSLHLLDRSSSVIAAAADTLDQGSRVRTTALDVTDDEAWQRFAHDLEGDSVVGLVAAAGILQAGSVDDVTPAAWDELLAVNLKGTYLACRALLPALRRCAGSVVTVASISGRTRSTYAAPSYVASKAGVIGLTMSLAAQEAEHGVRVNAVAPGVIDTPMTAGYGPDRLATLRAAVPLGRLGTPFDVAAAVAWLLSADSSYVTGQTLDVNGGQFMH